MANPYEVPFTPPDLGPAVALFQAARQRRKENKRADQYAEMQALAMDRSYERESHAQARQKAEDERRHQIEAITAMPTLMRAAQQSTGLGNMYGKPHGVSFSETHDLPANVEGPEMSPDAEAARFAPRPAPAAQFNTPPQPPVGALAAGEEGPEFDPAAEMARHTVEGPQMQASGYQGGGVDAFGDVERQRAADNMNAIGTGLQGPPQEAPTPEAPLMARAAANTLNMEPGPEGKRRLIASYGGGSFAVPDQPSTTGFGPKYDAIYQRFLQEPGVSPEEALKAVTKMAHEDAVESGRDTRAERAEDARSQRDAQYRMDIAGQFEQQRRALEQSDKNSRRAAAAGGGLVRPAALPAFVAAANNLKPGDPISPEVAKLASDAGLKPNQIAAEVDRYRNSDNKSMGGGKGPRNAKDLADLDEGLRGLNSLISQIETNPKSWDRYRENAREWARNKGLRESAVGAGMQFVGAMNLRPEEGLKDSDSKTLFQRQEKLNTSIAKGFGGVITEGDREAAASNQANFALDAREKLAQLKEMRENAIAKRDAYVSGASKVAPTAGAVRSVRMPDGSVQKFDASGARVE